VHTWRSLVASFVRCRERILVCAKARAMHRKIAGWRRVVERQMVLKKVVYIQERVVRMRHFRLWRGLTIIKRNMFWCQRRALHAIKHFLAGTATIVRDKWERITISLKMLWASNFIKHWCARRASARKTAVHAATGSSFAASERAKRARKTAAHCRH
jgi:hypothetical protein